MRFVLIIMVMIFVEPILAQHTNELISVTRTRTRTTGFDWVEMGEATIASFNPYLWMDASSSDYFLNENGNAFTCSAPNAEYVIGTWLDRSGNNRHFTTTTEYISGATPSPVYKCNSNNYPQYLKDSYIESDGVDDVMVFNFETAPAGTQDGLSGIIDTDFTFIFLMQATNPAPSPNDSFIANGEDWKVKTHWQIGATTNTSNFYFRLAKANPANTVLLPFDTSPHVYFIQLEGETVTFKIDGKLVDTITYAADVIPVLKKLKLYTNRAGTAFIEARFFEFFVFNGILTAEQEYIIQQYLTSKWGI